MKLLVLDLEGTIFRTDVQLPGTSISSTTWQAIAKALGPEAEKEEVATHERWERREYRSYIHWMEDTIAIHIRHGLTKAVFEEVIYAAEYNEGVVTTLSQVDRSLYQPLIVSGGFHELGCRAQSDLNIIHSFCACHYIFGANQKLKGYNLLPCDFEGKIDFIQLMLREYNLNESDWIFVGDGKNDVHVAKKAPFSIGYKPHADLKEVVTEAIQNFEDLLGILQ